MKLRKCQDRFRLEVSVDFIMELEQLLEKVSLQVGKLLIGQTGPFFPCPVAFKFCSVCLFVCLSPMQSESQVGARCRDSDKERTLTSTCLPMSNHPLMPYPNKVEIKKKLALQSFGEIRFKLAKPGERKKMSNFHL